jgi:hypothetical protein
MTFCMGSLERKSSGNVDSQWTLFRCYAGKLWPN